MPCSWKMSAGGGGAARKAHRHVSKRRVSAPVCEAGIPSEQAESDGTGSAET